MARPRRPGHPTVRLVADFRQQLTADLTTVVAEAKVDADKLAEDIAARVLADLGKTTTPPVTG